MLFGTCAQLPSRALFSHSRAFFHIPTQTHNALLWRSPLTTSNALGNTSKLHLVEVALRTPVHTKTPSNMLRQTPRRTQVPRSRGAARLRRQRRRRRPPSPLGVCGLRLREPQDPGRVRILVFQLDERLPLGQGAQQLRRRARQHRCARLNFWRQNAASEGRKPNGQIRPKIRRAPHVLTRLPRLVAAAFLS
eukprot:scaffold434_cov186-Pinguiococcus_pyrenoidosus.AAC.42